MLAASAIAQFVLIAAALPLGVNGDACPAPGAVELKLASLRAPGAAAPRYRLEVGRTGSTVLLTARDADGALWVQRELPSAAPCAELEDAAAVVLLAWEAQLQPGDVPIPEVSRPLPAPAPAPERALELGVRVSAAGQAWLSSASPTWGAWGAVELRGRWLGVELGVMGQGQRSLALSTGSAQWSRFSVSLGGTFSAQVLDGVDVGLGVAVVGGPFWVTGVGFDDPKSVLDFDVGATATAKLLLPSLWKLRPFIAVGGTVWFRRHVAEAKTPDRAVVIPFLEASPTLGLVFTP